MPGHSVCDKLQISDSTTDDRFTAVCSGICQLLKSLTHTHTLQLTSVLLPLHNALQQAQTLNINHLASLVFQITVEFYFFIFPYSSIYINRSGLQWIFLGSTGCKWKDPGWETMCIFTPKGYILGLGLYTYIYYGKKTGELGEKPHKNNQGVFSVSTL